VSIVLLDTCVVTDLGDDKSNWFDWSASTLEAMDSSHRFVINPIVYAESSVGYASIEEVEGLFDALDLEILSIPREALFLAGKVFLKYRKNQGTKLNVLPDFFIGAHVAVEKYKLMTRDKGRFATYFPTVELVIPCEKEFN